MPARTHLLLVDDNRMDVELTLNAFREVGLHSTVHVVTNGPEALDYMFGKGRFSDRRKYPIPNLILLDLKMPGMDGHEVLRQIKAAQPYRRVPVVILTSSQEDNDRAKSYDHGANSYVVKPISFDGFTKVVKQINDYWLQLNEGPPVA